LQTTFVSTKLVCEYSHLYFNFKTGIVHLIKAPQHTHEMTKIELKSNFHTLIDAINDESILTKFYELLSRAKDHKQGELWNSISQKEQDELTFIEKESSDTANLISNSDMQQKHKKWL